jgi:hypothetical protein
MPGNARIKDVSGDGDPADSPVVWFVALERARVTMDHALARRATAQLARLGVRVTFTRGDRAFPILHLTTRDLKRVAAQVVEILRRQGEKGMGGV